MEKRVHASFLQLCSVSCQQRRRVYRHFLIQLVMQLWENGGMHNKMQSISVFFSEFSKCLAACETLKDNFIIICFSKFPCSSSTEQRISTAKNNNKTKHRTDLQALTKEMASGLCQHTGLCPKVSRVIITLHYEYFKSQ